MKELDMQLPIGHLLVGDFNMNKDKSEAADQTALQPERCAPFQRLNGPIRWHFYATGNGRSAERFAAIQMPS